MGCYVSSYRHAIPSLPSFIFGENRVLKHSSLLPQESCFLTFLDVCATLTLQKAEISAGSISHLASKGFSLAPMLLTSFSQQKCA